MANTKTRVIGANERIAQRRVFATDYDRTNPPSVSNESTTYKSARKRAVQFWYVRVSAGYRAEVVGPFHSVLYGTCSFGRTRASAKARLKSNLARNHGFVGSMVLTNEDDADNVGLSIAEVWRRANNIEREEMFATSTGPISFQELCGAAGQ